MYAVLVPDHVPLQNPGSVPSMTRSVGRAAHVEPESLEHHRHPPAVFPAPHRLSLSRPDLPVVGLRARVHQEFRTAAQYEFPDVHTMYTPGHYTDTLQLLHATVNRAFKSRFRSVCTKSLAKQLLDGIHAGVTVDVYLEPALSSPRCPFYVEPDCTATDRAAGELFFTATAKHSVHF